MELSINLPLGIFGIFPILVLFFTGILFFAGAILFRKSYYFKWAKFFMIFLSFGLLIYPIVKYVNYIEDYSGSKKEFKSFDSSNKLVRERLFNNNTNTLYEYSYKYEEEGMPSKRTLESETSFSNFGRSKSYISYDNNGEITYSDSKYLNEFDGIIAEGEWGSYNFRRKFYDWGELVKIEIYDREKLVETKYYTERNDRSISIWTIVFMVLFFSLSLYFIYKYKLPLTSKIVFTCFGALLVLLFFQIVFMSNEYTNKDPSHHPFWLERFIPEVRNI